MKHNKELKNASWIIACKIVQSALALVINMLTARYLGPTNYGTIHYAASLVTFVTPIMQLGLNSILVQEIVHTPRKEGEILGTSIALSFVSSLFCVVGVTSFACLANAGETETIGVCALYSLLLIFQAIELIQYWFQAKLLSKYTSVVMLCAYLAVSAYKVFLLVTDKSIYWFALTNALDYLLIAFALILLYKRLGTERLSFSVDMAKRLLSKSKYFIVSSMMITVFSQTDKIMLKLMVDEAATGIYSAAVACALLSNFVFTAILDSCRPTVFKSKKDGDEQGFEGKMTIVFSIIIYLSLAQCLVMTAFSSLITDILYGAEFAAAADVLRVVVWYTTFSYVGAVRSIWILAEGKQKYLWIINLSGAVLNVALNAVLIPIMGVMGAAVASLVTQFGTNIIITQIIPALRRCNYLMVRSMNPKLLYKGVKQILKRG